MINGESDLDYAARYFADCSEPAAPIIYCAQCGDVEVLASGEWCPDCRAARHAEQDAQDAETIARWGSFVPTRGRR